MYSSTNGKVFGCLPVWAVIGVIALVTAVLEFIFFVLLFYVKVAPYKIYERGDIPALPPIHTELFLGFTFEPVVHYFFVGTNFALMMAACLQLPIFAAFYAVGATSMVICGLCKCLTVIGMFICLNDFIDESPGKLEMAKVKTVFIVAILWNLFTGVLYGIFAALTVICAKIMSTDSSSGATLPIFSHLPKFSRNGNANNANANSNSNANANANVNTNAKVSQSQPPTTDLNTPQSTATTTPSASPTG